MKHVADYLKRAEASLKIASTCPHEAQSKWLTLAQDWLSLAKLRNESLSGQGVAKPAPDVDSTRAARPSKH